MCTDNCRQQCGAFREVFAVELVESVLTVPSPSSAHLEAEEEAPLDFGGGAEAEQNWISEDLACILCCRTEGTVAGQIVRTEGFHKVASVLIKFPCRSSHSPLSKNH